jgi:hypothetical protein
MPGASRDRVTIDLRGIGDAVRAAAACRSMGVAQLVRRAPRDESRLARNGGGGADEEGV